MDVKRPRGAPSRGFSRAVKGKGPKKTPARRIRPPPRATKDVPGTDVKRPLGAPSRGFGRGPGHRTLKGPAALLGGSRVGRAVRSREKGAEKARIVWERHEAEIVEGKQRYHKSVRGTEKREPKSLKGQRYRKSVRGTEKREPKSLKGQRYRKSVRGTEKREPKSLKGQRYRNHDTSTSRSVRTKRNGTVPFGSVRFDPPVGLLRGACAARTEDPEIPGGRKGIGRVGSTNHSNGGADVTADGGADVTAITSCSTSAPA
jgi:hypothetical protein